MTQYGIEDAKLFLAPDLKLSTAGVYNFSQGPTDHRKKIRPNR